MFLSLLRWKCHLLQRALSHIQPDSVTGFFCKLVSFWLHPTPLALSGSEVFTDLSLHPLRWWWRHVCLISHSWQCPELCRAPGRRQCLLNAQCLSDHQGGRKAFWNAQTAMNWWLQPTCWFSPFKNDALFLTSGFKTKISASVVSQSVWPSDWILPHLYGWLVWSTVRKGMEWWLSSKIPLIPIWQSLSAHWMLEPGC